jgi:hypothetical protein
VISATLAVLLAANGPTRLAGPADAVQLCRHLTGLLDSPPASDPVELAAQEEAAEQRQSQVLDSEFEVRLPPREFRFGSYDSHAEVLDIGSRLTAGHGLIDLQAGDVALELDASPAEASRAYHQWREGKGALRVTFDLDDATRCEGSPFSPPWFLQVHVLSLSFVDQKGEILLNGANGLASHDVKSHGPPAIAVQPIVPLNGRVDAKRVAGSLQGSAGLQQCYTQALGATPELEGTVVFQARIDGRGRPTDLLVTLEDLGSPDLVSCLGSSLKGVTLAGASPGSQLLLPLELRL